MIRQLKQLRNTYIVGAITIIALVLTGTIDAFWLFWLFFLTIITIGIALYVIVSQITCPTCGVPLLSRKAIRSPDKCYNCGRDLNGPKRSKRDVADELFGRYKDEKAARTDWTPLQKASANFDTHRLHISKNGRISFKPAFSTLVFDGVFILFGIVFYTVSYVVTLNNIWMSLLSLLFVGFGLFLLRSSMKPIRVNRRAGLFVLGWNKNEAVMLEQIEALQLLPYSVLSNNRRYANYQLNLVMSGERRKNIVTYFHLNKAVADAEQLASSLGLKLWNGIDRKT